MDLAFLEEGRTGALSWAVLHGVVAAAERAGTLSDDARHSLKERLKSEVLPLVLNTLTALHTISLNCGPAVRDQIAHPTTKVLKHLERLMLRPPIPGVEAAAAQLLLDWSFLFGREELGVKAAGLLSGTRVRPLVSPMRPTDVAVAEREQRRVGMPRLVPFVHGYDFGLAYAHPLEGPSPASTTPVLAAFAHQSLQDGAPAAGAAGSSSFGRQAGAALIAPEQEAPKAIAERVIARVAELQSDVGALATAQRAAVSASRHGDQLQLSRHLDAAFSAAARCDAWRQQVAAAVAGGSGGSGGGAAGAGGAVLGWRPLSSQQVSQLLSLADQLNAVLESWQRCTHTELWRPRGSQDGSTGGSARGSARASGSGGAGAVGAGVGTQAATAAALAAHPLMTPMATGASAASAGAPLVDLEGPRYLDLLTGDTFTTSSTTNPFLSASLAQGPPPQQQLGASGGGAQQQPQQQPQQQAGPSGRPASRLAVSSPVPGAAAAPGAPSAGAPAAAAPGTSAAGGAAAAPAAGAAAAGSTGSSSSGESASAAAPLANPFAGATLPPALAAAAAAAKAAGPAGAPGAAQERGDRAAAASPEMIETHVLDLFSDDDYASQQQQQLVAAPAAVAAQPHAPLQPQAPAQAAPKRAAPAPPSTAALASASGSVDEAFSAPAALQPAHLQVQPAPHAQALTYPAQQQRHAGASPAPPPLAPALRQRLHATLAAAQQHAHARCGACGRCSARELVPVLEHLLAEVAAEHASRLAALEAAHKAEVAEIKATAVRRLKEVMGQQPQQ